MVESGAIIAVVIAGSTAGSATLVSNPPIMVSIPAGDNHSAIEQNLWSFEIPRSFLEWTNREADRSSLPPGLGAARSASLLGGYES